MPRPTDPTAPSRSGRAPAQREAAAAAHTRLPAVKSEALFGDAAELQIDHRGVVYRLRQTSLGKLILTK
jgi:hemin uptake protein HemP